MGLLTFPRDRDPERPARGRHRPGGGSPLYVGLDVGTTSAKAAAFSGRGERVAAARRRLPALCREGAAVWQPLAAVVEAAEAALLELSGALANAGRAADVAFVALSTQRDTLVLTDGEGAALTELISWRDARDGSAGSLWDALAGEGRLARAARARSLTSYLTERWTGRAVETPATLPRHLEGSALEHLRTRANDRVERPETVAVGDAVGRLAIPGGRSGADAPFASLPLRLTAGDKNCELLGAGVTRPGVAAISLGSAISFGTMARAAPPPVVPATVATPAALGDRWNVETGLLVGVGAERILQRLLATRDGLPPVRKEVLDGIWCLPWFAGALDAGAARAAWYGVDEDTEAPDLVQAWAQGVAGELRRLRPALERAADVRLDEVTLVGGGASEAWGPLFARALRVPVRLAGDPWSGARGAVASALATDGVPPTDLPGAARTGAAMQPHGPDPDPYFDAYERLAVAVLAAASGKREA